MKTSNKIFLAAVLILFAYMVGYDFTLKTEYEKGTYKNRFYGMHQVKLSNFNSINHKAGNMLGLHVEQGKTYGIWVDKYYTDKIKITQQGQTLNITYVGKEVRQSGEYEGIIITCPAIDQVVATTYAAPRNFNFEDNGFSLSGTIEVKGFKQDSPLSIKSSKWIKFSLLNNTLAQLNANLGTTLQDSPSLTIDASNHIQAANLFLNGKSSLSLYNTSIAKPNYHFGDSTTVTLSGASLTMVQPK